MSNPKYTKAYRGERLDVDDVSNLAEMSQRDGLAQIGEQVLLGPDADATIYVLYGLKVSGTAGNAFVTIAPGAALGNFTDAGIRGTGSVVESPISEDVQLTGLAAAGVYTVYAQIQFTDVLPGNRGHWNEVAAGSPVEYARNVPTRRTPIVTYRIATTSPGTDWAALAEIDIAGGFLTATPIVDIRDLFWEGKGASSYDPDIEWSSVNNRNPDRGTYGVKGLRQFARAIQTQLTGLIQFNAAMPWWSAITKGVNDLLALDGSRPMVGPLLPDADGTRSIGSSILQWLNTYSRQFTADVTPGVGYRYGANINVYWRAKASDCVVDDSTMFTRTLDASAPGTLSFAVTAGVKYAQWRLELPSSATIQDLTFERFSSTGGVVQVSVFRESGVTLENLRSGGLVSIPITAAPTDIVVTGFDTGPVVDNTVYTYIVLVKITYGGFPISGGFSRLSVHATTSTRSPD